MTEEEIQKEIGLLVARLKELRATPRSDWHREFEDILQIEIRNWGNNSWVIHEVSLGEDAPRIDFIVMSGDKLPENVKEVFHHFRKLNIIEYKRPGDVLNRRTIRKVEGYGSFYIGLAQHEGDVPEDDVTITIFTAFKNEKLFKELENQGIIVRQDDNGDIADGIYHVRKITDLPYVIVVTDELQGDGYAAFRALTDHADEKDVERLLAASNDESDADIKDRYSRILSLIGIKNPGLFEDMIRRNTAMEDYLMGLLKPRIDKEKTDAIDLTTRNNLFIYVQDGAMTVEYAANKANLTPSDFLNSMEKAGYKIPQMA